MKNKNLRPVKYLIILALISLNLSACSIIPTLELTDEETDIIAEYASDLLLKHDTLHRSGLVEVTEESEVIEEAVSEDTSEEEIAEESVEEVNIETSAFAEVSGGTGGSISSALGFNGISVNYSGMDICDTYPDGDSQDLVFSMNASTGNKLLILHFAVVNETGEEVEANLFDSSARFRLTVNGDELGQQQTILDNDLSQMYANMAPGSILDEVLVFEAPAEIAENISSLSLSVRSDAGSSSFELN